MFKLGWEVCKAMVGTPHKVLRYLSSKGGTQHNIEIQGRLTAGWLAGSVSDYSTTLWIHLSSGESKIVPKWGINGCIYIFISTVNEIWVTPSYPFLIQYHSVLPFENQISQSGVS